ncbi:MULTISPECIES: hypothetical protein [Streptomyces]|uniref:hypothetical protein n=1 Tax=Streptomyces TaxID=1883 RepID=UPI0018DEF711|nr:MULTISPECIES: hypothetical protein [Streptomyces]MCZ4102453.1 hypothetical protein [Streptomyces sp. H39-C1]
MDLKALGYWRSESVAGLPDVAAMMDVEWDESEREIVADYLNQGQIVRQFMGVSRCRVCNEPNGNAELTDGEFIWPTGLSHYLTAHAVRLPSEFVMHVFRRLAALEEAKVDHSWWNGQGA